MPKSRTIARRVGIALAGFVIAWIAVAILAQWIFGSGNALVYVLAAIAAAGVYVEVWRRDRRIGVSLIKLGVLAAAVGTSLIFLGVFGFAFRCAVPGVPCPSPSLNVLLAYGGLAVLVFGVVLLVRAGWNGSLVGSGLAATAALPAAWFGYEIVRQEGCPLLADPAAAQACLVAYGEMTAPVISFGAAGLLLLVGWLRWRRRSASHATSATAN